MLDVPTRLHRAILSNDLLMCQRIILANPKWLQNPDYNDKGNTSLHYAAKLGFYTIAAFLVDAGHEEAEISRNYDGQTPLHVAAASLEAAQGEEMVHFLASRFPSCLDVRDKTGKTALMLAATSGNDPIVNILADFGSDIDAQDNLGNASLHYASAFGHLKTMRSLIDRGASHEIQNRKGWTPRMYSYSHAAEQYFLTLIKMDDNKRRIMMGGAGGGGGVGVGGGAFASVVNEMNKQERAATPVLGRREYDAIAPANRPRASSGS